MRSRVLLVLGMVLAMMAVASPAWAIPNGVPDDGEHPQVGQLLFYDPTAADPRFPDTGGWFNCTGTLGDATTVITAGHCTFGTGTGGAPTPGGSGGTDVWISFAEVPDTTILPPSSSFATNADRYAAWSSALEASPEWVRGTAVAHPQYDDAQFFAHDLGVLTLQEAQSPGVPFGRLPTLGLLDTLVRDQEQRYTPVGYGLEESGPNGVEGGDTRRKATQKLVNLNGANGIGKGTAAKFSNNLGSTNTGGTCFGDSGGPIFLQGTTTIAAVTSFGINSNCAGTTGGYRLDQQDDLDFLATFGLTP